MNSLIIEQSNLSTEQVEYTVIDKLYRLALTSNVADSQNNFEMSLVGNITATSAYEDAVEYLRAKFSPNLMITVLNDNYYIRFTDPIILQYCVQNYGGGIGVTKTDAAGVQNVDFWGRTMSTDQKNQVTSLDDFLYFTGISGKQSVLNFPNATSITFADYPYINSEGSPDYLVRGTENLQTINYNNAVFTCTSTDTDGWTLILGNNVISEWSDSLVPKLNNLKNIVLFRNWSKLTKIIYREGITSINGYSRGNLALLYIEFPTTIEDLGFSYNFGRDNGHIIAAMVVKSVNPPHWYGWREGSTAGYGNGFEYDRMPESIYVPDSAVSAYKNFTGTETFKGFREAWASPYVQNKIKPMSEMPDAIRALGTVTQEDIDRV